MKAKKIQFSAPRIAELVEFDTRPLEEGDVAVRTQFSAVSNGTERACLLGAPNTAHAGFPKTLGYSSVGIVAEVGNVVTDVKVGDRVLVYHGIHASVNVVAAEQATAITDPRVASTDAALVIIASMGLGGVRKLAIEFSESAMVMGLGLLGLFAVQFCRLSGSQPVIAVDPDGKRRQLALALGADHAFDPLEPDFVDKVKALTEGKGVRATVEVTGIAAAMNQSLACAARQGRIALLGCTRVSDASIDYYRAVHVPGIKLIGAHNLVRPLHESYPHHWTHQDDCQAILRMVADGRVSIRPIISEIAPPEEAPEIYRRLAEGVLPVGVLFDWTGTGGRPSAMGEIASATTGRRGPT